MAEKIVKDSQGLAKDLVNDCISRQAAIDMLKNRWKKTRHYEGIGDDIAEECELYLKQVPSAQPTCTVFVPVDDCISRQAAVDAFTDALNDVGILDAEDINTVLQMLPPAQPDRNEQERTGADLISRQAAIHAICRDGVRLERGGALMITISTAKQWAVDLLGELPSAQPEIIRCRECRYKYGSDCDNFAGVWVKDDDFCSRAERREVNE